MKTFLHSFFFIIFLLIGFVHGLLGRLLVERERDGECVIGVPDRTKEERPGLDSRYYHVEPFRV